MELEVQEVNYWIATVNFGVTDTATTLHTQTSPNFAEESTAKAWIDRQTKLAAQLGLGMTSSILKPMSFKYVTGTITT